MADRGHARRGPARGPRGRGGRAHRRRDGGAVTPRRPAARLASRLGTARGVPRPAGPPRRGAAFDHSRYERALAAAAPEGWRVDYGAAARSSDLAAYRRDLAAADPASLPRDEQLAFWINAYNASLLSLVAERMPVPSALDIDGAFGRVRFRVGRAALTADEIEHGVVRRFGDPRVHFGLNRASVGSPPLVAYAGAGLGAALEENGRRFLADEQRGADRKSVV